jgi:hypothetical protein
MEKHEVSVVLYGSTMILHGSTGIFWWDDIMENSMLGGPSDRWAGECLSGLVTHWTGTYGLGFFTS